jgi:hypothetical protein
VVEREGHGLAHLDLHAEFFQQFSLERIGGRLPFLHGTAGKFPQPTQVGIGDATGKEATAIVTLDDGRDHESALWPTAVLEHPQEAWGLDWGPRSVPSRPLGLVPP